MKTASSAQRAQASGDLTSSKREAASSFVPRLLTQLDRQTIQGISGVAQVMPALPSTTAQLLRELSQPHCSHQRIAELVQLDPSLAAELLHCANSAAQALDEEVTRVDLAVLRLGCDTVQALALRSSVASMLHLRQFNERSYDLNAIWRHSVATSIYAGALARRLPRMDSSEAVTAGLLHDIGKIIVNIAYPAQVAALLDTGTSRLGESLLAKEQRLMGACHTAFGAMLARHWNLPSPLVMAIELHHHPALGFIGKVSTREAQLIAVCFAANQMAKLAGFAGADVEIDLADESLMQSIGLSPDIVESFAQMPPSIAVQIKRCVETICPSAAVG